MVQLSGRPSGDDSSAPRDGGGVSAVTERLTRPSTVVVVIAMVGLQLAIGPAGGLLAGQAAPVEGGDSAAATVPASGGLDTAGAELGPQDGEGGSRLATAVVSPDSIVASTLDLPDTTPPVVAVVLGYSHREDADALEHETRHRLYEAITESPGTYIAEVAETTGTAVSTVRYHLRILEREDVIRSETVHGKRRLYTAASGHDEISAALNDRATTDVVEAVIRHEPASVSQLADELDRAVSTVSYHVQRLETTGVLTRERDGGSVRVEVASSARTVVEAPVSADD